MNDAMSDEYEPSEKAVKIVEKIKEMTGTSAIFIDRKPDTVLPRSEEHTSELQSQR